MKETKGSDVIYYLYEQTGMIGFELNGTPYYDLEEAKATLLPLVRR